MKTKKTNKTKEQIKAMLFQLGANLTGMIDRQKWNEKTEKDVIQKEFYKVQQLVLESQKSMVNTIYKLVDGEFYKKSK